MSKLTDEELIEEIRQRFEFNRNALTDLRAVTRKLEEMNEKLQESERVKSHFLSNIRNEINNPLSAIMGLSGQLTACRQDPELCLKTAAMIYAEAFNLDFQLQNIFMAAELEAGDAVPDYARVDVPSVISGCLDKFSRRIAEKQLEVRNEAAAGLVFPTDAQKVEIIVSNLLANAVEFSPAGGTVTVTAAEREALLEIAVADTGPGIAAADREAIFDRFRQLDVGTTKEHRGHGLGLSICWSLAELLGGTLDLDSRPSKGCRFVLMLPRPAVEVNVRAQDANLFLFDRGDELERF
ncbi:MAG: HAMP domain-containing histidine kinase [Deltaproteobacteria bacterium]|nr:MAG: HAMP domain-containing histidine kinase [Deltaproteobacteria bacterium]